MKQQPDPPNPAPLVCDSCGRQISTLVLVVRQTAEWDEAAERLRTVERQERWCRACLVD